LDLIPFKPVDVGLYYSLHVKDIPKNLPSEFNVKIREGSEADIEELVLCIDKRQRFLTRFRQGEHCLLAFDDEQVAGFIWYSIKDVYEEEQARYQLTVPRNTVYSFDEYVSPEHRRKGILSQLFAVLYEWMGRTGRDTILILIAHDNEVSWEAHLKKGFVPLNRISYLRIFGWRMYHVRSAVSR